MKIILNCTNLLGDSLYLLRPVQVYMQQYPDVVVHIVADPGLAFELFVGCFGEIVLNNLELAKEYQPTATVITLSAGTAGEISFKDNRSNPSRQMHMSEAYAQMLNVDLGNDIAPPKDWHRVVEEQPKKWIAISPFSRSCSRHSGETPNKTLDDSKWEFIIRYLRRQGYPVKVIAGPNDKLKVNSVPVNDYFTASSLYELELFIKQCALVISLDNGLGHIASALNVPMISLWPKVSNHQFIAPRFGDKTVFVLMEPNSATPAMLLSGIRRFARPLLGGNLEHETKVFRKEK